MDLQTANDRITALRAHGTDYGYAIGDAEGTPRDAAEEDGLTVVEEDDVGRVLCVDGDSTVLVVDLNGPWAYCIGEKWLSRVEKRLGLS